MKYFTPELIQQLDSSDRQVAHAADAEWDRRLDQYESDLQRIAPELPAHVREFNDLLLHDARVECLARRGDQLFMVLYKDIPPRDLVILTYTLTDEPYIDQEGLPPSERSPVMDFLYDEFDLVREGGEKFYTQSILFGNGWEMRLRFRDVQVTMADPIYPLPRKTGPSLPADMVSQPA